MGYDGTSSLYTTVINSFVYPLRLNVQQYQKFCHRTIAYFVKIHHTVHLAIFQYIVSGKVNKQMTCNF